MLVSKTHMIKLSEGQEKIQWNRPMQPTLSYERKEYLVRTKKNNGRSCYFFQGLQFFKFIIMLSWLLCPLNENNTQNRRSWEIDFKCSIHFNTTNIINVHVANRIYYQSFPNLHVHILFTMSFITVIKYVLTVIKYVLTVIKYVLTDIKY